MTKLKIIVHIETDLEKKKISIQIKLNIVTYKTKSLL